MKKNLLTSIVCLVMSLSIFADSRMPLETVEYVNLQKYKGQWYEIARLPQWFQRKCLATRATYTLREDGNVTVFNECKLKSGKIKDAKGLAKIVDSKSFSKLKVSFDPFRLFYGPYWILGLAQDYSWALVGSPDRSSLWILSRTPEISVDTENFIKNKAIDLGFDVSKMIDTPTWK